jgi:hypothetical protein
VLDLLCYAMPCCIMNSHIVFLSRVLFLVIHSLYFSSPIHVVLHLFLLIKFFLSTYFSLSSSLSCTYNLHISYFFSTAGPVVAPLPSYMRDTGTGTGAGAGADKDREREREREKGAGIGDIFAPLNKGTIVHNHSLFFIST